jgi:hypothetical protein
VNNYSIWAEDGCAGKDGEDGMVGVHAATHGGADGAVMVGGHGGKLEEGAKAVADGEIAFAQPPAVAVDWLEGTDGVDRACSRRRHSRRVLSVGSNRRRASRTVRSTRVFITGEAETASPASMADWRPRNWCARQIC